MNTFLSLSFLFFFFFFNFHSSKRKIFFIKIFYSFIDKDQTEMEMSIQECNEEADEMFLFCNSPTANGFSYNLLYNVSLTSILTPISIWYIEFLNILFMIAV